MREILLISSDHCLARSVGWVLRDAGFSVALSCSLEEVFLQVGGISPAAVVIDLRREDLPEWSSQRMLSWLHRRSPVVLLTEKESSDLEAECDYSLPLEAWPARLTGCLQSLFR